jgi:hypothetical protein
MAQTDARSWAIGTSLAVIAYHERIGERTIQNRIDQSLDTMQREFSRPRFTGLKETRPIRS